MGHAARPRRTPPTHLRSQLLPNLRCFAGPGGGQSEGEHGRMSVLDGNAASKVCACRHAWAATVLRLAPLYVGGRLLLRLGEGVILMLAVARSVRCTRPHPGRINFFGSILGGLGRLATYRIHFCALTDACARARLPSPDGQLYSPPRGSVAQFQCSVLPPPHTRKMRSDTDTDTVTDAGGPHASSFPQTR